MTTIFNSSYLDTLRRIDGKTKEVKASSPRTFSEILAERNKVNSPPKDARAALAAAEPAPQEMISNLSPVESVRFEIPVPEPLKLTTAPTQNLTTSPQKLAPAPSLPPSIVQESGRAPQAPKVLAAKRVATPLNEQAKPAPTISRTPTESFLEQLITAAGKKHGVDPALSIAVARAESSLKVNAVSKDGHASKGIFQLLDTTGQELMGRLDVKGDYEPFDPKLNTHLGVGYLRRLHDLFSKESNLGFNLRTSPVNSASDLEKVAVAAFNAGEGNVARAQRIAKSLGKDPGSYNAIEPHLPASTRAYVSRVSALKSRIGLFSDEETLA